MQRKEGEGERERRPAILVRAPASMHVSRNKVIYVGRDMKVARKIPLTLRYSHYIARCMTRALNYLDILRNGLYLRV